TGRRWALRRRLLEPCWSCSLGKHSCSDFPLSCCLLAAYLRGIRGYPPGDNHRPHHVGRHLPSRRPRDDPAGVVSSLVAASAPCGHGKPRPVPSRRGLRHSRLDLWQITTTNAHSHSSPGTATQYRQEELLRGAASTQRSSDRHTPA